jgi:hypothetical protein
MQNGKSWYDVGAFPFSLCQVFLQPQRSLKQSGGCGSSLRLPFMGSPAA